MNNTVTLTKSFYFPDEQILSPESLLELSQKLLSAIEESVDKRKTRGFSVDISCSDSDIVVGITFYFMRRYGGIIDDIAMVTFCFTPQFDKKVLNVNIRCARIGPSTVFNASHGIVVPINEKKPGGYYSRNNMFFPTTPEKWSSNKKVTITSCIFPC